MCAYVCLPLCQHLQNSLTLSPALYHPGCVKGSQEASGATCPHGPEGLNRNIQEHINVSV